MRILILVDCYYPSPKSGAKLIHDLALELSGHGHEIVVMAPSSDNHRDLELSLEDGLTVARVKVGKIKGASRVLRAAREMRLSMTLWRKARNF
ncbi:MAG TPA: glycosyltransferase WbuB, partial [Blastocatellia bacterium]|nr:glycosyltransferase WbuB [Blastocatellia bacterium]